MTRTLARDRTVLWGVASAFLIIGTASARTDPANPGPRVNSAVNAGSSATNSTDWPLIGLTHEGQHFSPLQQINDKNVQRLGLAWHVDMPSRAGLVGVPIVVDGVVYQSGQLSIVYANDVRTGRLLWSFDPQVRLDGELIPSLGARVNRGVAVWEDKVFVGTGDCRLVAIERASGAKAWDADVCVGDAKLTIAGAPRVANGKVFIGPANMDDGSRRGYLDAYDAATGKRIWRFYTVPGDPAQGFENAAMERASKTFGKDYWKSTGGGSVVDGITYDPVLNLVYFGTTSITPNAPPDRGEGHGDELFGASVIAVNADTGEYVWHYQQTPVNGWNYDSFEPIVIAELPFGGKKRRVLLQAPKNGYFYALDARTGELLAADQYGVRVNWSSSVDTSTGRPVVTPSAQYWLTGRAVVYPGVFGAHSLYPMAFSPLTGLVYISGWDNGMIVTYERRKPDEKTGIFELSSGNTFFDALALDDEAKAPLIAWDPVKREIRWKLDEMPPMGGGTLATAGNLVFYGKGDGLLRAFAADTGTELWSVEVPGAVRSTPITVEVDGEQVVLLSVGSDGGGAGLTMGNLAATEKTRQAPARLLAFKLGGSVQMPALEPGNVFARPPLPRFPDDVVKQGAHTLLAYACDFCHGGEKLQANVGTVPDLRKSGAATHTALEAIVIGGAYKLRGMPQFADMPVSDLKLIQAFIIDRAWDAYDEQQRAKATAR